MFQSPLREEPLRIAAHLAWLIVPVRTSDRSSSLAPKKYLELSDGGVIESTEATQNLLLNFSSVGDRTIVVANGVLQRISPPSHKITKSVVTVGVSPIVGQSSR